jgi:hypothetical protein
LNQILNHPSVKNGRLYKLGCFLALETDMPADEACATLDKAHAGNETVHRAGGYDDGAQATETWRREIQAQNDAGYELELAKRGGRTKDNRSDRQKQQDEEFFNIAQRANGKHDEDEDDTSNLKAMGFGGGAQFEQSAYSAGAASAARLLGKSSSAPASYPAPTAARPASAGYARESVPVATRAAPAGDAYAQGAESARRLLGGTASVRAELNHELHERFAEQQRARAQR